MPDEIETSASQVPATQGEVNGTADLQIRADTLPDKRYSAEKVTDALPPAVYERLGQNALVLEDKQIIELELSTPDDEVDIRPDNGVVYASHEYYRRKLNKIFGYMGWTLIPGSGLTQRNGTNEWYQRWVLFVNGVYVSEAIASRMLHEQNRNMDLSDVAESIKSDALRRCCKDLGIATECWNKRWVARWRKENAIEVVAPVWKKGQQVNEKVWRRKDADPFPGERGVATAPSLNPRVEVKPDAPKQAPAAPPAAGATAGGDTPRTPPPAPPPASKPAGMKITEGQIRLLWQRARGVQLVVANDAALWIDWLKTNAGIKVPDISGRTSEEIATEMMKAIPGTAITPLVKKLDALKKAE